MADLDLMMAELQGVQQQQQGGGGGALLVGGITVGGISVPVATISGSGGGGGAMSPDDELEGLVWYQVLQHPLFSAGKGAMERYDAGKEVYDRAVEAQHADEHEEESGKLLRNLKLNLGGSSSSSALVGGSDRIDGAIHRVQCNPYDLTGWRVLLAEIEELPMSTVRPVWRVFKSLFPRSGYYLAQYAAKEMEDIKHHRENLTLKLSGTLRLCNLFHQHLAVGMTVNFYKIYLEWLRSPPLASNFIHSTSNRMQSPWGAFPDTLLEDAFKNSLAVVGRNMDSTSLWQDYLGWYSVRLSSVPQSTGVAGDPPVSAQQRWVRGMYHHILQLPIEDLPEIRAAYDAFERAARERARFQLEDRLEKVFKNVAKVMYPERHKLFERMEAKFLPRPLEPPAEGVNNKWRCDAGGPSDANMAMMGGSGASGGDGGGGMDTTRGRHNQDDIFCYDLWEQIIATERRVEVPGAPITDAGQIKRIGSVLKQRLCYFPFDLGCWMETIQWFQGRGDHAEVATLMEQIIKHATPKLGAAAASVSLLPSPAPLPPLLPSFVYADYLCSNIKTGKKSSGATGSTTAATSTPAASMLQTAIRLFDTLIASIKQHLNLELAAVAELSQPSSSSDGATPLPSAIWSHLRRIVQLNKDLVLTHCVQLRWVRFALWGTHGATASRLVGRKGLACPKPEKAMVSYLTDTVKLIQQLDSSSSNCINGGNTNSSTNTNDDATSASLVSLAQQVLGLISPFFMQWIDVELDLNRGSSSASASNTTTASTLSGGSGGGGDELLLDEGAKAALSLFHGWAVFVTDAVLGNASPKWTAIQCGCDTTLSAYGAKLSRLFPTRRRQIEQRLSLFKRGMMKRLPPPELWASDPQTRLLVEAYSYIDTLDGESRILLPGGMEEGLEAEEASGVPSVASKKSIVSASLAGAAARGFQQQAKHDAAAQDHVARHRLEVHKESGGQFNLQQAADGQSMGLVRQAPLIINPLPASHVGLKSLPDTTRWNRFEMPDNRIGQEKKERQQHRQQRGGGGGYKNNTQQRQNAASLAATSGPKSHDEMTDEQLAKLLGLDDEDEEDEQRVENEMGNQKKAVTTPVGNMFGAFSDANPNAHRGGPASHVMQQQQPVAPVKTEEELLFANGGNRRRRGGGGPGSSLGQGMGYVWVPDVKSDLPFGNLDITLTTAESSTGAAHSTNEEPPTKRARHEGGDGIGGADAARLGGKAVPKKKILHRLQEFLVSLPNEHACIGRFAPFLPKSGLVPEDLTEEQAQRLEAEMEGYCEPIIVANINSGAGAGAVSDSTATNSRLRKTKENPQLPFEPKVTWLVQQLMAMEEPLQS